MPINPIMNGGGPAPVEGDDEGYWTGMQGALRSGVERTLGYSTIRANIDSGPQVSAADAAARLKAENYDTSGIPAEGMSEGALNERMERASAIRQGNDLAARAHLGTASQVVAGVAAQLGDPLNIVLAPVASLAPLRAGLAGRAAIGAVEGAGFTAAYEKGQNIVGKHFGDPDITSQQMLRDMMFGAGVGGVLHSAFGPRPLAPMTGQPVTLDMIDRLGERTANYSKATGIPVDQVVSKAGAIGRYQVEPATAAQYLGMNGKDSGVIAGLRERLRDPEFNKMVAGKIVDDLNKKFPGDPEAVAIAYNAGPGAARRFIKSGRDYGVLPEETRQYAARVAGLPRSVRIDAAKMAIANTELDSKIDVKPVIDGAMAEHFKTDAFAPEPEAMQTAVPKQDSLFTEDETIKAAGLKIDASAEAVDRRPFDEAFGNLKEPANDSSKFGAAQAVIDPELAEHVTNDVQEAKSMQEKLGVPNDANKLRTALKLPTGEIRIGKSGQIHAELFKPGELEFGDAYEKATGFATPSGEYLDRDQARAWVEKNQPGVAETMDDIIKKHGYRGEDKNELIAEAYRYAMEDHEAEALKQHPEFEEPEPHMIEGLPAEDHQKAVEAAVRCGLLKGGFE